MELLEKSHILVADSCVIINFLCIDRMDIIENYQSDFIITEHVLSELTVQYQDRQEILTRALDKGIVQEQKVMGIDAQRLFARLMKEGRIGAGECSAIALAVSESYNLAIDDRRAIKEAYKTSSDLEIIGTKQIVLSSIDQGILTVKEADAMRDEWALHYRFQLKESFSSLRSAP